jgi:hypothetical protein
MYHVETSLRQNCKPANFSNETNYVNNVTLIQMVIKISVVVDLQALQI